MIIPIRMYYWIFTFSIIQHLIHLKATLGVHVRQYLFQITSAVRQCPTVPVVMGGVKHPWGGTALKDYLLHRSRCHYGYLQRVDWLEKQTNHIKDYTESNTRKSNKLLLFRIIIYITCHLCSMASNDTHILC